MTPSALTPSSNLFDVIGPAADNADFQVKFQKAKMISKGDPNQRWVKAILPNGEECFLFSDDEGYCSLLKAIQSELYFLSAHRVHAATLGQQGGQLRYLMRHFSPRS
jgi:hypothetical protein